MPSYSAAALVKPLAVAISRPSHSGEMSKPLGHVGAPNWRNTREKQPLIAQRLEHGAWLVHAGTAVAEADAEAAELFKVRYLSSPATRLRGRDAKSRAIAAD